MYQPRKVFILENGGYTELSYEEFSRRKETDPSYADKLFLPLYGMIMSVGSRPSLPEGLRWNRN